MVLLFLFFLKAKTTVQPISNEPIASKFIQITYENSWVRIINPQQSFLSPEAKKKIPLDWRVLIVEPQNKKTPPFTGLYTLKILTDAKILPEKTFYSKITLPPVQNLRELSYKK